MGYLRGEKRKKVDMRGTENKQVNTHAATPVIIVGLNISPMKQNYMTDKTANQQISRQHSEFSRGPRVTSLRDATALRRAPTQTSFPHSSQQQLPPTQDIQCEKHRQNHSRAVNQGTRARVLKRTRNSGPCL